MATALLDSLKKSIGKKKSNSQAFAWLADLERESGDLDTALARVDGGLTLYPSDVPAMLVRSVILFEKGDFDGCITECERVLKYDPFCLSAQKRMGDAYEQLGNENERNKCYRRVHDMDPLDTFWKEEYDHVEDVAVVAATATALTNDDFSMPEDMTMDATPDAAETAVAEAAATATESIDAPVENSEAAADEEDPFAAFASIAATQDSGEEAAMDSLQSSLDSAMQDFLNDEPSMPEEFPEDEKVSGSDVSSAFNDMFGEDDDLEPEAPASPFAKLDLPTSLDEEPAAADTTAQNVFGNEVEEDKPQSVDSAFNDIFGEDELPEEKPQSSSSLFEKSADSLELPSDDFELPAADAAPAVTGNADSLFEKSSESSLFEKSADEFELPAEDTPAVTGNADSLFEKSSESSLFEKSADDFELPAETATEELAPAEPLAAEPPVEPVAEQPAAADDQPFSVDSAFDSLFGEDDLPEENPQNTAAPAVEPAPSETLAEQVTHAEEELSIPATENADTTADDFAKEMGGAFTNIFGDTADDLDLPEAKPAGSFTPSEEDTGAAIEEAPLQNSSIEADIDKSFSRLFGEDDLPEEGENKTQAAPAAEPALDAAAEAPSAVETESLEKAVDGAFKGLFETDDDTPPEEHVAGNKGVDFLMSGDSDDEVSSGLIKDPSAPLSRGTAELDESLNTRTLAEIYYEQGLVDKALDIYEDLARKEPQNTEILNRLMEIEKAYREKFGGEANG